LLDSSTNRQGPNKDLPPCPVPIQKVRKETMYMLGLASGLLADSAYEYLKTKAGAAFTSEDSGEIDTEG